MPGTPPTRFVYLGPEGTFTEQALRTIPAAEHAVRTPARSVPEALEAVRVGDADAALVPLENSVGGAVPVTLDELGTGSPLVITREVVLPVEFVLASASLTPLASVRSVAAHPQASAQCRGWLQANMPDAVVVDVLSNAAAAVAAAAGEFDAAICAPIGVPRNNLTVLAEKIADRADAVTRFALLSRPAPPAPPTGDDVTSLALMIDHDRVGALLAVLTELAVRGINLSRIESRPTGEQLGVYVFFLDCTGHIAEPRLGEALQGLRRICSDVRFLGSYPKHRWSKKAREEPLPSQPGLTNTDFADSAAWLTRLRSGEPA
ncbi:prephenate dehydratase [Winogradskya consettensis]|uniref:Prephenate dehydratase n=1 Tax=Winogradskya consettensis TaxID=113560 RepID=A0A919SL54_9ACTN|nr:prephenate dehydratase [Actinoplanes consettensis]GIM74045.1 prephenate dehydratase [Actinoplanes consettensis]